MENRTMRACDNCRRRKVKCNFNSPQCCSCQLSDLLCAYTVPPKKRGRRFRNPGSAPPPPSKPSPSSVLPDASPLWPPLGHFPATTSPAGSGLSNISSRHQRSARSPAILEPSDFHSQLYEIHKQLEDAITQIQPNSSIGQIGSQCIDLYMQYLFPIMPLVHERNLRQSLAILSADSNLFFSCHSLNSQSQASTDPSLETNDLSLCRVFSLLTAVCAETCMVLPSHILTDGSQLANHFLKAFRSCLNLQQDNDVESPNSYSVIIRYFHSNSIHAMGKAKVSWFLLGEAIRMAQALCLHHKYPLENIDPIEAQLRRNIFWQLHTGDKSAALLNNRPFILHEFTLRDHISVRHASPEGYTLLDTTKSHNAEPYESRLMQSFHLCQSLWGLGAKLLLDFQLLEPFCTSTSSEPPPITEKQASAVLDAYIQFLSFADDMPEWLKVIENTQDVAGTNQEYQRAGFWIQRVIFRSLFSL